MPSRPQAEATSVDAPRPDDRIDYLGTEPFFAGTVEAGRLTHATPESSPGRTGSVSLARGAGATRFVGALDGQPVELVVFVEPCSDGMSERRYPYRIELTLGGASFAGCASSPRVPFVGDPAP